MPTFLKVVGGIWAVIGFGNIILLPWNDSSDSMLMFGLIFNMVLFVIPGLVLFGLGAGIARKRAASHHTLAEARAVSPPDVRARLEQLRQLHDSGHVTETEYEQRRAEILRDT